MGVEEWRPIKDFEDRYLISNYGQVKVIKTNQIRKTRTFTNTPYVGIALWDGNKYHNKLIHILVAEAFLEKPDSNIELEVDHIDCNPKNNQVDNLQWITHKENLERSFELGHQNKLKKPVGQYDLQGNLIATYESYNEAFRQTNIWHINEAANGTRNTAGGYIWKYL